MILPRPARAVFLAFICWSVAPPVAAATYAETFTPKAGRAYNEDINVWVYTSEFAERFGMPEKWIDDDLKGAYAVAFRVETASGKMYFPHKGSNVNMPIRRCIIDIYVSDSVPIPWSNEQIADSWWYTPDSPTYLAPQAPKDQAWRRRPMGIPISGENARRPLMRMNQGTLNLREYDRQLYPGIVYLSFHRGCTTPSDKKTLVEFCNDEPWTGPRCHAAHEIVIPAQYMNRLKKKWYEDSRKPALKQWETVIRK